MNAKRYVRSKQGASLGLIVACAASLVALAWGCFQLAMLFAGGQDARNTVDAGALNVAKCATAVKVLPTPSFADCVDSTGAVGLTNINRVWGKALLETANDVAMNNENLGTDAATTNVDNAFQDAQTVNDNLYGALFDGRNLSGYFDALTTNRSVSTFKTSATMVADNQNTWETARVDRGAESNLSFLQKQFPAAAKVSPLSTTVGSTTFMDGYTPLTVGDKQFYFVSFRTNEMPHLISQSYFQQNRTDKVPIGGVSNAIPNAFAAHGLTNDAGTFAANAYAVANPQRSYFLAIPHAFLTIRISNTAKWYVNGKKVNETTYGLASETQWGVKELPLQCGGKLNGYASLGNEYKGEISLLQVLRFLQGDITPALTTMVQRLQEIDPSFERGQLEALLSSQHVTPEAKSYIIYPFYTSADATWPNLNIQIAPQGSQKAAWLVPQSRPEGMSTTVVTQEGTQDFPNTDWQMIVGGHCTPGEHSTLMTGQLNWQPGTGVAQSLGELSVNHITQCFFSAQ